MSMRSKVLQQFEHIELDSKEKARKWLFCCVHAVHLGLLDRSKLQEAIRLCKTIYKNIPQIRATYNDWELFEYDKPVQIDNTKYTLPFWLFRSTATNKKLECCLCNDCNKCYCGCGKTKADLQRLAAITARKLIENSTLKVHAEFGYSQEQIRILNIWQKFCKHGRHGNLACNCSETSILAEFGHARAWTIPDKQDRKVITKTLCRLDNSVEALTSQEKKLLRRHFLTCSTLVVNHYFDSCGCNHTGRFLTLKGFAKFLTHIHQEIHKIK